MEGLPLRLHGAVRIILMPTTKPQSSQDANSVNADPLFVSTVHAGFTTATHVPIDQRRGCRWDWRLIISGEPSWVWPDLGAYEFYGTFIPTDIQGDFIFHTVPDE